MEFVAESTSDTINDIGGCAVEMVIDLVRSVGSTNVCFRINELTSEFLKFQLHLNETSGRLGKIGAVSGSDCRILKFLRTTFLAAKLLGWKVSVKGIRYSLLVIKRILY